MVKKKREMSLDSVVFEEFSGGGGGGVCNICLFEMEGKVCLQVCVFQSAPAPLSVSPLCVCYS